MSNEFSSNVIESTPFVVGSPHAGSLAPSASERQSSAREPSTDGVESLESVSVKGAATNVRARLRSIGRLPNHRVVSELLRSNLELHRVEADLLLFLGELDLRQLYREHAVSSTFEFCVNRLGYSEDVAYKRVGAARLIRCFPRTFELLVEGRVHLTALMLIKPHLTKENHEEWLSWVCGKSKRQIEKLVASRCPQPDAPTSIRRMSVTHATIPEKSASTSGTIDTPAKPATPFATATGAVAIGATPELLDGPMNAPRAALASSTDPAHSAPGTSLGSTGSAAISSTGSTNLSPGTSHGSPHSTPAATILPLSSDTYRVTFTGSERLMQRLERAREILSHCISPRDLPALLERALDCLLDHEEKRRFGTRRSATLRISKRAPCGDILDGSAPRTAAPTDQAQALCHRTVPAHRDSQDPDPARLSSAQSAPTASHDPRRRRRISASIRRAVFERDGGQCTILDWQGRRYQQRRYL